MAISENDKKVVLDALRELGAKDPGSSKNVELITNKCRTKGPLYSDKQKIALILQTLQNEKKVTRKAGEKAASYYLAPSALVAPKPVTIVYDNPADAPKSDNPYL